MVLEGGHPAEDAPLDLFIACGKWEESRATCGVTAHGSAVEDAAPVESAPGNRVLRRINLRRGGSNRHTLGETSVRRGGLVEIGEPERTYTVEPVQDPVPRERPAEPAEPPASPSPAEEPLGPEKAPAP